MAETTFDQLPASAGLSGNEIVPIDTPIGGGNYVTGRTTAAQIANLAAAVGPVVLAEASPLYAQGRVLAGTVGDITVTDGGPLANLIVDLAATAVAPGTYGNASAIAQFIVDQKGRLQSAGNIDITGTYQPLSANLTSWALVNRAAGFDSFTAIPSSANLRALMTDESGTGSLLFQNGNLGTPTAGVLTNATGLPVTTGISGLATNIAAFLAGGTSAQLAAAVTDETGSGALVFATSPALVTPNLGTPSAAVLTNATGLPIATGVSGLAANMAAFLAGGTSAQLAATVTDETGTGALVFGTSPTVSLASASSAVTQTPGDSSTKLATTAFVQAAIFATTTLPASKYATVAALPAVTYANGASGVGATLTENANGALSVDGVAPTVNDVILVKNQVSTLQNGVYTVTATGSAGAPFVLTRATYYNLAADINLGDTTFVSAGNTLGGTSWSQNGTEGPVIGTNPITFAQVAGPGTYTAGNGLSLSGTQFAIDTSITVDKTTAQTLTNKTIDTAAGNSLSVAGVAMTTNTGTGPVVRGTSPTLTTPSLGAATATSLAITSGASLGTNYSSTYSGTLGLTTASLQSPLTTNAAYYLHGTTTSLNQNFLAQYELISNTVSNTLGGAVALDVYTEATANSGGVWTYAGSVTLDAGFAFGTYSAIGIEQDINNQAGDYSDIAASASLGVSLNGLGYRNSAALYVNNMQQYVVATSATTAGNSVLTFSGGVPAYFKVGGVITDLTSPSVIPANTTILSATSTTITLSANVTGAGVAIGDHIQVAQPLWYQGIKFAPYGVLQYSINDQSNSATVLNVGGSHSLGIDFTSATIAGAAIRLGVGASQGITARFSGTDYALLSADAAGRGVIGNTTLGTRFNGTVGIGVNPDPTMGLLIGGTITNGAGNALGFDVTPTLVPVTGAAGVFFQSGGAVNTGASNTIAGAYSAYLAAPTKTGTGTITTAYSLFLEAPASGATNYSLYAAGASRFATSAQIDGYLSRTAPVIKTADFTVAATDNWLICNKGSTLTVTLPAVASFVGREITIKTIQAFTVVSATSNVIPLAGGAAGTAILAATAGKWATLVSDGTSWNIMAGN